MRTELQTSLNRFIEHSSSEYMPEAAAQLLEMIEADAVEPLGGPGKAIAAEELADRLENRVSRLRRRGEDEVEGLDLIEDAVAHLRAHEDTLVAPWAFEDSEGVRWFVLAHEDEVVACYTSKPFVEADI
jgi:hypothetical protein